MRTFDEVSNRPHCCGRPMRKNGKNPNGATRYFCPCCKNWCQAEYVQPRISEEKRSLVIKNLNEKISMRGIARALPPNKLEIASTSDVERLSDLLERHFQQK